MFSFCHLENCTFVLALHVSATPAHHYRGITCSGISSLSDWNEYREWSWMECICDIRCNTIFNKTSTDDSLNRSTFLWLLRAPVNVSLECRIHSLRMLAYLPSTSARLTRVCIASSFATAENRRVRNGRGGKERDKIHRQIIDKIVALHGFLVHLKFHAFCIFPNTHVRCDVLNVKRLAARIRCHIGGLMLLTSAQKQCTKLQRSHGAWTTTTTTTKTMALMVVPMTIQHTYLIITSPRHTCFS